MRRKRTCYLRLHLGRKNLCASVCKADIARLDMDGPPRPRRRRSGADRSRLARERLSYDDDLTIKNGQIYAWRSQPELLE